MFIAKSLSAVVILATACTARPTSSVDFNGTVVEKLASAPVGWVKDSSAGLDKDATSITLKVHLVNQDMDKFHDLAMNVRLSPEQRYNCIQVDMESSMNRSQLPATHSMATTSIRRRFLL